MRTAAHRGPAPFTVLVVCTGNICRSPLAEQLFRARLQHLDLPAEVHSAGTNALVGHGMTPEASAVAQHHGGAPAIHVARQLTAELVSTADLVLTATREHRSAVVALHPRAARYSYTLNQFARLVAPLAEAGAPADNAFGAIAGDDIAGADTADSGPARASVGLRALVAEVAASRGFSPPPARAAGDDIDDPYRRSEDVYERVGVILDEAVTTITTAFAAAARRG